MADLFDFRWPIFLRLSIAHAIIAERTVGLIGDTDFGDAAHDALFGLKDIPQSTTVTAKVSSLLDNAKEKLETFAKNKANTFAVCSALAIAGRLQGAPSDSIVATLSGFMRDLGEVGTNWIKGENLRLVYGDIKEEDFRFARGHATLVTAALGVLLKAKVADRPPLGLVTKAMREALFDLRARDLPQPSSVERVITNYLVDAAKNGQQGEASRFASDTRYAAGTRMVEALEKI